MIFPEPAPEPVHELADKVSTKMLQNHTFFGKWNANVLLMSAALFQYSMTPTPEIAKTLLDAMRGVRDEMQYSWDAFVDADVCNLWDELKAQVGE